MKQKYKHEPLRRRFPNHPSGKANHYQPVKRSPVFRIPASEPETPRLRTRELQQAIGFHANIGGDWNEID